MKHRLLLLLLLLLLLSEQQLSSPLSFERLFEDCDTTGHTDEYSNDVVYPACPANAHCRGRREGGRHSFFENGSLSGPLEEVSKQVSK